MKAPRYHMAVKNLNKDVILAHVEFFFLLPKSVSIRKLLFILSDFF